MSGQPKRGLEFAGWDVHMFDDDERIDELIDAQGWTGFIVVYPSLLSLSEIRTAIF